jgi:hypothetical protein
MFSFDLTQQECGSLPCPPTIPVSDAVEVTIDLSNSTTATVTFTAPDSTTFKALLELNINGAFDSSSTLGLAGGSGSPSSCGYGENTCVNGGEDTFGQTSLETGSDTGLTTATIDLIAEDGNSWANAADVLTPTCGPANRLADPSCVLGYDDPSSEKTGGSTGYGSQYSNGFEAVAA